MDEENKRRLPTWMVGVVVANQVNKSKKEIQNNNLEEGNASKTHHPYETEVLFHEGERLEQETHLLGKCKRKKSKGKSSSLREHLVCDTHKTSLKKKSCERVGRTFKACKKQKVKGKEDIEIEVPSQSEEEDELTMEDIMSIAEEFVKAEKNMCQQQLSIQQDQSEVQLPASALSIHESGVSFKCSNSKQEWCGHETVGSSYDMTECPTSEETGNPTQDMLDLLLGPLLKKPIVQGKKNEFILQDLASDYDIRNQKKNNMTKEVIPSLKKKSSLKDKVAMLLD